MKHIGIIIEVLVESLLCILAFILIVWLLTLFDCLSGKQYEIVITFLGVIATFVVINNFHQIGIIEQKHIKQIAEQKHLVEQELKDIKDSQSMLIHLLKSSPEYKIAKRIIEQQKMDIQHRFVFKIAIPVPNVHNDGFMYKGVKIKSVTIVDNELEWLFMNPQNGDEDYFVDISTILYIKMEEILEYNEECSFKNPNFITILKYLLSQENE